MNNETYSDAETSRPDDDIEKPVEQTEENSDTEIAQPDGDEDTPVEQAEKSSEVEIAPQNEDVDTPSEQPEESSVAPLARPKMMKIVYILCTFNGLCAVFFGGLMMLFPVDTPLGLGALLPAMGNFPFQVFFRTLFWPGFALILCNGVGNLIAAGLFFRKRDALALWFAYAAGILLILWDVYEMIFLPNPLAVFYGLIGVAQVIMCLYLLRKQEFRRQVPQQHVEQEQGEEL